ncbi:MATE family efflux transporter [Microbacterium sp.]|uniref:MATE family efflux transporter n=1 Tax=Microbacterium sp. TaxID=51671 RepID=UPI0039E2D252
MPERSSASPSAFARKGLLRLSWPLLVITVLTLLATLGNVVLLSAASPELNAAVASANQLLGVLYDISVLFSLGALVIITQQLGAGDLVGARRSSSISLRASSILGLAMAVAIGALAPHLLRLINTPAEIIDDATAYLWIVAFGLAFNAYIVAASAVLRAYGRTVALLVLGTVVNLLDVSLLAVFLLVLDLGAVGAALPTLIVRGIGVIILAFMVRRRTGATLFGPLPAAGTGRAAWTMARLSIPTVLESAAYNVVIVAVVASMNLLGTDAINARSYALTLTALVTGVILAFAQGNETIVGWDVGGRTSAHARRQTLRTAAGTAIAAAVLAALLWLGAEPALAIFGVNDAVLAQARDALLISILLLPLSAVTSVVYGALRSAGDVVMPMLYSIGASAIVLLPLSLVLVPAWGVAGVFWALVAGEAVRAALLLARWIRGSWQRIAPLTGSGQAAPSSPDAAPATTA